MAGGNPFFSLLKNAPPASGGPAPPRVGGDPAVHTINSSGCRTAYSGKTVVDLISSIESSAVTLNTFTCAISDW